MGENGGDSEGDLAEKLKQAGIDYGFVQDVNKLEETRRLVKAGKVKPEVYKQLEEGVLRRKQAANAAANSKKGIITFNLNNLNENINRMFKRGNFKSDNPKHNPVASLASESKGFIQKTQSQRTMGRIKQGLNGGMGTLGRGLSSRSFPVKNQALSGNGPTGLPILKDELLRMGNARLGKNKWRKVYVVLYKDALEYFKKEGDSRPLRRIQLNDPNMDYFVSEVVGGVLKRADTRVSVDNYDDDDDREKNRDRGGSDSVSVGTSYTNRTTMTNQSEDVLDQPHLFLLSNLQQKYYFAAEDEVKKQFWVMMLTTVIRDIMKQREETAEKEEKMQREAMSGNAKVFNDNGEEVMFIRSNVDNRSAEEIQKDFEARQKAYEQSQKSRFKNHAANDLEDIGRWKRHGDRVARQSVAQDWFATERAQAQNFIREQELLKMEIKKKDEELKLTRGQLEQIDGEWQKKYDDLLEKFRQQALERRNKNISEEQRLRDEITSLRRMSVMPGSKAEGDRDYEAEIEMYKTKLKALQAALKVDIENLDWDGTLEDAEKKMKVLIPDLMSEDPQVQQEAQKKFDQWDQIIRNHSDYISRETRKWASWEEENFEKNLDALNEMRQIAPKIYFDGCTEEELMEAAGIMQKTAARVKKNNIFRFFWMDKDSIAKIHIADLTNKYASQGLDIRELRAVYATLPDEFQIDSDGRKKTFRDNLRNRLFELTEKEKNGTLATAEEMNNAYREKDVRDKPKIAALPPGEKPRKVVVNQNMKNKALALQAMLEKRGGGAPAMKKPEPTSSAPAAGASPDLNPDAEEWKKYFRMKKAGLPDGAIMNGMQKDGKDPSLWFKLVEMKEKGITGGSSAAPKPAELDPNADEWSKYFKMQKAGLPDGAIMNGMAKDGKDPKVWTKLVRLKGQPRRKSGNSNYDSDAPLATEMSDKETKEKRNLALNMTRNPKPKLHTQRTLSNPRTTNGSATGSAGQNGTAGDEPDSVDNDALKAHAMKMMMNAKANEDEHTTGLEMQPSVRKNKGPRRKLKPNSPKRNTLMSDDGEIDNIKLTRSNSDKKLNGEDAHDSDLVPRKKKKKKTLRRQTKEGTLRAGSSPGLEGLGLGGNHMLMADADALVKRAQVDHDVSQFKRGSHGVGNLDYASNMKQKRVNSLVQPENMTKSQQRAVAMGDDIERSLEELVDIIMNEGKFDEAEGGLKTMKFIELFVKYEKISDMLVGLLLKGKRSKILKYRGDMLFKGIHDDIKITVLKQK